MLFFLLTALATLLPYLPIIMSQLGVRPKEIALIYFLIFFLTFLKNVFIGFIADKYRLHKVILVLSCILTGPLYALILAVPAAPSSATLLQATTVQTSCQKIEPSANTSEMSRGLVLIPDEAENTTFCQDPCSFTAERNSSTGSCSFDPNDVCRIMCQPMLNSIINQESQLSASSSAVVTGIDSDSESVAATTYSEGGNTSSLLINKSITSLSSLQQPVTDSSNIYIVPNCDLKVDCIFDKDPPLYRSFTFWACLSIGISAALCGSNELVMNDAIAISLLGEWVCQKSFGETAPNITWR